MGKKHFCFFQTAETGNRTPDSGVKGSGANHYPRAPAQETEELKNYRLISLNNIDFKIIAFTLANRLQNVIGKIIGPNETAYVKNGLIVKSYDLIGIWCDWIYKCKNSPRSIFKFRSRKSFDTAEHNFFFRMQLYTFFNQILLNGSKLYTKRVKYIYMKTLDTSLKRQEALSNIRNVIYINRRDVRNKYQDQQEHRRTTNRSQWEENYPKNNSLCRWYCNQSISINQSTSIAPISSCVIIEVEACSSTGSRLLRD